MGVSPTDLENAMNEEFEKVKKELISEEEFQKLKNQVENDFVNANTKMAGIAENLANYQVYFKDANLINTEITRFMKVTREDLQKSSSKISYKRKQSGIVLLAKTINTLFVRSLTYSKEIQEMKKIIFSIASVLVATVLFAQPKPAATKNNCSCKTRQKQTSNTSSCTSN
jgi:hypothetical protein